MPSGLAMIGDPETTPPGALAVLAAKAGGMRGVTLRQLNAFSFVARRRSFVRAAEELCLTAPAVSLQIKELESNLGVALFDRRAKAVLLTRAGELLLADVQRALSALRDADSTLSRLRAGKTGAIRIGMVSNAMYFLPRLLARFRQQHSGVQLQLSMGNRGQLIDCLRQGLVEFAVMGQPPTDLKARADVFASQPLAIVAAPGHELARLRSIPVARLAEQEFVLREPGSGTRAAMEGYFRRAGFEPPRGMEMSSNEGIKQAVMVNLGLAFLSLHTVGLELGQALLVSLDAMGLPLVRHWFVAHMDTLPLTGEALALRDFIAEHGGRAILQLFDSRSGQDGLGGPVD